MQGPLECNFQILICKYTHFHFVQCAHTDDLEWLVTGLEGCWPATRAMLHRVDATMHDSNPVSMLAIAFFKNHATVVFGDCDDNACGIYLLA